MPLLRDFAILIPGGLTIMRCSFPSKKNLIMRRGRRGRRSIEFTKMLFVVERSFLREWIFGDSFNTSSSSSGKRCALTHTRKA